MRFLSIATLTALAACGPNPGAVPDNAAAAAGVTDVPAPLAADDTLDRALTCWGLANRAYFMHQAVRGGGGNLPSPDPQVYIAWSHLAAVTAHGRGMTLADFEARQRAAQQAATVYSLKVKPDHAAAVQRCIDAAPERGPDPDLNWPDK
ncbi:hypothetical protein [Sphingomonas sp.]|uniref:hypothetical protein n=1 Tax=Sphingomonas sp. TaxID=28214 RepID=UPI002DD64D14|nr:hypothetical protein [Sphingomonas sp.]